MCSSFLGKFVCCFPMSYMPCNPDDKYCGLLRVVSALWYSNLVLPYYNSLLSLLEPRSTIGCQYNKEFYF